MPAKRLFGSCTPGRRVSSARFATVSRPVYASIASGSANAISCHDGEMPSETPCVSALGDQSKREAEDDEQQLGDEIDPGDADARGVHPVTSRQPRHADRCDHAERDDLVPRPGLERRHRQRVPEVVRQEERRERGDDQVVEEERPAGDEAGQVVERAAHEGRGAAGLPQLGRPLGVRERDDEEEHAGEEEDERRQAERVRRDDPEREVDRARDLAVGDREEIGAPEPALEPRELTSHARRLPDDFGRLFTSPALSHVGEEGTAGRCRPR